MISGVHSLQQLPDVLPRLVRDACSNCVSKWLHFAPNSIRQTAIYSGLYLINHSYWWIICNTQWIPKPGHAELLTHTIQQQSNTKSIQLISKWPPQIDISGHYRLDENEISIDFITAQRSQCNRKSIFLSMHPNTVATWSALSWRLLKIPLWSKWRLQPKYME